MITGGRGLIEKMGLDAGHTHMKRLAELPPGERRPEPFAFDGKLTFSKEHLVGYSGTAHEADQPSHLVVADTDLCSTTCAEEYGNPCEKFCPAAVYEMVPKAEDPKALRLQINFSNCVHCKTCDVMDPYQIINWVTPEGGGGPRYDDL